MQATQHVDEGLRILKRDEIVIIHGRYFLYLKTELEFISMTEKLIVKKSIKNINAFIS